MSGDLFFERAFVQKSITDIIVIVSVNRIIPIKLLVWKELGPPQHPISFFSQVLF